MTERPLREGLKDLETGPRPTAESEADRGPEAEPGSHPTVAALRERFDGVVLRHEVQAGDEHVVFVVPEQVRAVLSWLKEDGEQRYDFLADLTAVDYGGGRPLEVVYQLWSIPNRRALRVKAVLPLDALEVDSAVPVWAAANWLEREVFDLFGIHFRGHPDLRRILMPERYAEGHPLRKDFPLRGRFSRAEQTRRSLAMAVEDYYTPAELALARDAGAELPAPGVVVRDVELEEGEHAPGSGQPTRADHWALGAGGSAAGGAPAPGEVTE